MVHIVLPFPPSVNGLYGGGSGQRRFPTKAYKAWLRSCPELHAHRLPGPVRVTYTFVWPDKRQRDGQNYLKAPMDYLVNEGVLVDDNWQVVVSETWTHAGVDKQNARVEILIVEDIE